MQLLESNIWVDFLNLSLVNNAMQATKPTENRKVQHSSHKVLNTYMVKWYVIKTMKHKSQLRSWQCTCQRQCYFFFGCLLLLRIVMKNKRLLFIWVYSNQWLNSAYNEVTLESTNPDIYFSLNWQCCLRGKKCITTLATKGNYKPKKN